MILSKLSAFGALVYVFVAASSVQAQNRFATSVVNFTQGTGGGTFVPTNALGGPTGAGLTNGSLDVCSLGVGGSLTLGFDVLIANGPGADFAVFENAFTFGGEPFSEVAFVEVSSNGLDFARFPTQYAGPSAGLPGFTARFGTYSGVTGFMPILANVLTNSIDPFDPTVGGGEGFDLSALSTDALVVGGLVNLNAIQHVRIVDVAHASAADSFGNIIHDNSGATGTADIDAVAVINHVALVTATQPIVELFFDGAGHLNLLLEDPNGFGDLDQAQLRVSYNLVPASISRLRGLLPQQTVTTNGLLLRSAVPMVGSGRFGVLAVSAKDFAGEACTTQIVLQG